MEYLRYPRCGPGRALDRVALLEAPLAASRDRSASFPLVRRGVTPPVPGRSPCPTVESCPAPRPILPNTIAAELLLPLSGDTTDCGRNLQKSILRTPCTPLTKHGGPVYNSRQTRHRDAYGPVFRFTPNTRGP